MARIVCRSCVSSRPLAPEAKRADGSTLGAGENAWRCVVGRRALRAGACARVDRREGAPVLCWVSVWPRDGVEVEAARVVWASRQARRCSRHPHQPRRMRSSAPALLHRPVPVHPPPASASPRSPRPSSSLVRSEAPKAWRGGSVRQAHRRRAWLRAMPASHQAR